MKQAVLQSQMHEASLPVDPKNIVAAAPRHSQGRPKTNKPLPDACRDMGALLEGG